MAAFSHHGRSCASDEPAFIWKLSSPSPDGSRQHLSCRRSSRPSATPRRLLRVPNVTIWMADAGTRTLTIKACSDTKMRRVSAHSSTMGMGASDGWRSIAKPTPFPMALPHPTYRGGRTASAAVLPYPSCIGRTSSVYWP